MNELIEFLNWCWQKAVRGLKRKKEARRLRLEQKQKETEYKAEMHKLTQEAKIEIERQKNISNKEREQNRKKKEAAVIAQEAINIRPPTAGSRTGRTEWEPKSPDPQSENYRLARARVERKAKEEEARQAERDELIRKQRQEQIKKSISSGNSYYIGTSMGVTTSGILPRLHTITTTTSGTLYANQYASQDRRPSRRCPKWQPLYESNELQDEPPENPDGKELLDRWAQHKEKFDVPEDQTMWERYEYMWEEVPGFEKVEK